MNQHQPYSLILCFLFISITFANPYTNLRKQSRDGEPETRNVKSNAIRLSAKSQKAHDWQQLDQQTQKSNGRRTFSVADIVRRERERIFTEARAREQHRLEAHHGHLLHKLEEKQDHVNHNPEKGPWQVHHVEYRKGPVHRHHDEEAEAAAALEKNGGVRRKAPFDFKRPDVRDVHRQYKDDKKARIEEEQKWVQQHAPQVRHQSGDRAPPHGFVHKYNDHAYLARKQPFRPELN